MVWAWLAENHFLPQNYHYGLSRTWPHLGDREALVMEALVMEVVVMEVVVMEALVMEAES